MVQTRAGDPHGQGESTMIISDEFRNELLQLLKNYADDVNLKLTEGTPDSEEINSAFHRIDVAREKLVTEGRADRERIS